MPGIPSEPQPPPFHIPSVDITPYIEDPTGPAAQAIIDSIRTACLSTGFFQLFGQGVPRSLQSNVFSAASKFFALPESAKLPISLGPRTQFRGYNKFASQSYGDDVLPDLKEGFFLGADIEPSHPQVLENRYYAHPNVWPPEDLLPQSEFKDPLMEYYNAMLRLSDTVFDLVAATFPPGSRSLDEFRKDIVCPMRLLHYTPTPNFIPKDGSTATHNTNDNDKTHNQKPQFGASAHTDFNSITLLLQDEHEGLEVFDRDSQTWNLVPPNKDAYVVNLGDLMIKLTDGVYKSSLHRVVNRNPNEDRMSVVFFNVGNVDYKIRPLWGGGEGKGMGMTVEDWMLSKMRFAYERRAKAEEPEPGLNPTV